LTGSIPPELGQLKMLKKLALYGNELTGSIPVELGQLETLGFLNLSNNKLTGSIPPELGQLKMLKTLNLRDNELTGSIPVELGQLEALDILFFNSNKLAGAVPDSILNLEKLRVKEFWNNPGLIIPLELQNPEILNVSCKKLTGAILGYIQQIPQLDALKIVHLHSNELTGSIPVELGQLENLESLNLFNNKLTGIIPPQLGQLKMLKQLELSGNQLTGSIPLELGLLENLEGLYLNSNKLTGIIPPQLGQLTMLKQVDLGGNELTGSFPSLDLLRLLWTSPASYPSIVMIKYRSIFNGRINIRVGPNVNSSTIDGTKSYLEEDESIEVLDRRSNWVRHSRGWSMVIDENDKSALLVEHTDASDVIANGKQVQGCNVLRPGQLVVCMKSSTASYPSWLIEGTVGNFIREDASKSEPCEVRFIMDDGSAENQWVKFEDFVAMRDHHFNDDGVAVNWSKQSGHCNKVFCGRHLGRHAIPGSDGQCGPNNGPPCDSCKRYAKDVSDVVLCQTTGHEMVISDYKGPGYSSGFTCNLCRSSRKQEDGPRWFCKLCHDDYCFDCVSEVRSCTRIDNDV
jgi:hypothetical protein